MTSAADSARCVWHLTLAYDGTAYNGWQIQPDVRTIQGELEKRLRLIFRCTHLRVAGSSRTDAGVHALDQHVSFTDPGAAAVEPAALHRALNRWLPNDIRVLAVEQRELEFHARYRPLAKAYTYVLCPREAASPFTPRFAWIVPGALDLERMRAATPFFIGEQDFASFGVNPKEEIETTVRRVFRCEIVEHGPLLCVNVIGESFLYKMVRSMVGWLVHVGKGDAAPEDTAAVLAARNRTAGADSAPGQGLFLARVFFPPSTWEDYRPFLPPWAWMPAAP